MRGLFKTKAFARWSHKAGLRDLALRQAVTEMQQGLFEADLGGGVIKKRIALPGRGKRGGSRTLVATNRVDRWFFVFGFEKAVRANVSDMELEGLQRLAADLLSLSAGELERAVRAGLLQEIGDEEKD